MAKQPKCELVSDGTDLFVVFEGVRIARRGRPRTPQARTWVSLEPGFIVRDCEGELIVERSGVRVQ